MICISKMCVFVSRPMTIVTFPLKNRETPKRVVDIPLERDTFRNKIMEIVEDFDEKSYNNNGKPCKSSMILRVKPNFFIFPLFLIFRHFFVFFFHFIFPFLIFLHFLSFSFMFFLFLFLFLSLSFFLFLFFSFFLLLFLFLFSFFLFFFFFSFCRGLKI